MLGVVCLSGEEAVEQREGSACGDRVRRPGICSAERGYLGDRGWREEGAPPCGDPEGREPSLERGPGRRQGLGGTGDAAGIGPRLICTNRNFQRLNLTRGPQEAL